MLKAEGLGQGSANRFELWHHPPFISHNRFSRNGEQRHLRQMLVHDRVDLPKTSTHQLRCFQPAGGTRPQCHPLSLLWNHEPGNNWIITGSKRTTVETGEYSYLSYQLRYLSGVWPCGSHRQKQRERKEGPRKRMSAGVEAPLLWRRNNQWFWRQPTIKSCGVWGGVSGGHDRIADPKARLSQVADAWQDGPIRMTAWEAGREGQGKEEIIAFIIGWGVWGHRESWWENAGRVGKEQWFEL